MRVEQAVLTDLAGSEPGAPDAAIRSGSAKRKTQPVFHTRPGSDKADALKRASHKIQESIREKTGEWKRIVPKGLYQNAVTHWARRFFRGFVMCVMVLMSASLFYLLIIMGDSLDSAASNRGGVPAQMENLPQSPLHLDAGSLNDAKKYFNAPILRLSANSKWTLEDIWALDDQPAGVGMMVREVRLRYRNDGTGGEVYVSSITPSRYLRALPARGFATVEGENLVMANMRAVLMSNGAWLHAHAQSGESIYQMEGQVSEEEFRGAVAAAALLR